MNSLNRKIAKSFRDIFSLLAYLFLFVSPIFAQSDEDPPRLNELFDIVDKIIEFIFPFASFVAVVFIIMGGYMWISSSGDPAKIKQAQGTLTWAIIGLIFTLLTPAILRFVLNLVQGGA